MQVFKKEVPKVLLLIFVINRKILLVDFEFGQHYRVCTRTEIAMVVACKINFFKFLFGNDYPV